MKKILFLIIILTLSFTRGGLAMAGPPLKTTIFTQKINQLLPEPQAGLLNGILFGEKAAMGKKLYNDLITTGTIHMVALSGMNITILINLISQITLVFGRRKSAVLSLISIIGFIWLVGASASVVRAAIMAVMGLIAVYFGRKDWSLLSLLITGGIMLIFKPQWLFEISFQLSFLATLGIILLGKSEKLGKLGELGELGRGFRADLRTTLAAQIFTLPVILYNFKRVSLVAPLANVLIGWTIPFVMGWGLVLAILAAIWLPLAYPLAWILWPVLSYIIKIIEVTAKIPFASIQF